MHVRGATGELRWAYLPACVFGPWRLETYPGGASLEASLVSQDDYRLQQQPLTALLYVGRQTMRYPVESVTVNGGQVSATLGPPQPQKGQR
jgi:hypothetical protein